MKKYLSLVLLFGIWSCEDEQKKDCSGVPGGTAVLDNCDQCIGGETIIAKELKNNKNIQSREYKKI